jgi:uncharacterized protein (TIGR00369 family)
MVTDYNHYGRVQMRRRIINPFQSWKDYHCFGCCPDNPIGLRMNFFEEGDLTVSEWQPQVQFEGYPNVLHGGIQATLIDEVASWTVYTKVGTGGMTYSMNLQFKKPVHTQRGPLRLEAIVKNVTEKLATVIVDLLDAESTVCTKAEVNYYLFPEPIARKRFNYPGVEAFFEK